MDRIEIDRRTLYEEVWSTPLSRLAERFGLSDVALKKVCRRMGVPTPPRGYWARVRNGHAVKRPRLPAPGPDTPEAHTFYPRTAGPKEPVVKPEVPVPLRAAADAAGVPDALRNPDPFVARTRDALRARVEDRRLGRDLYGRVYAWGTDTLDVDVCPDSVSRALRILDAILKGARKAGFGVEAGGQGEERAVHFIVEGEPVPFLLRERVRQERVERPEKERYGSRYRFSYHPTGMLTLELTNKWYVPRHTWRDTERQRLEDLVGSFLVGVYRAACAYRDRRLEDKRREEGERRRAEEERRQERLRAEEAARRRRLEEQAERWRQSRDVAAFVEEVARRAATAPLEGEARGALDAWLIWAREHAERLDPLSRGLPPFPDPVDTRRRFP